MKKTLVVDIGGTHVKLMMQRNKRRAFDSGSADGAEGLYQAP